MLKNKKSIILLFDSFGIGYSSNLNLSTNNYYKADTLGHIVDYFTANSMIISLPNLSKRGLKKVAEYSRCKKLSQNIAKSDKLENVKYGYCSQISKGKDTSIGHWEIVGVPSEFDLHYFLKKENNKSYFDKKFIYDLIKKAKIINGFIDAGCASGTDILKKFGFKSCVYEKPIIYTSSDSVFQVAAHEKHYGLNNLLNICQIAREIFDEMNIKVGRVIARPFVGENSNNYVRTDNRKDFSIPPPSQTLLDKLVKVGGKVVSVGKVADIYANNGITRKVKASGLKELFDKTIQEYNLATENTIIFTNFVDLDSNFGHRRDPKGYGRALEYLDSRMPELDDILDEDTIVILTADHGCDPTAPGWNHTKENIPFLLWGKNIKTEFIGARNTFADIGQTIAHFMGIDLLDYGKSIFR